MKNEINKMDNFLLKSRSKEKLEVLGQKPYDFDKIKKKNRAV